MSTSADTSNPDAVTPSIFTATLVTTSAQASLASTIGPPTDTRLGIPVTTDTTSIPTSLPILTSTAISSFIDSSSVDTSSSSSSIAVYSPTVLPTPMVTAEDQENSTANPQGESHDSRLAVIISSTTLALVVILILSVITWCYVMRRRRRRRSKRMIDPLEMDKENGSTVVDNRVQSIIAGNRTRITPTRPRGRGGGGGERSAESGWFNSMDMVVSRDVLTSATRSPATATSTPPPPPYGNNTNTPNQSGTEPQGQGGGLVVPQGRILNRSSSINGVRISYSSAPTRVQQPQHQQHRASSSQDTTSRNTSESEPSAESSVESDKEAWQVMTVTERVGVRASTGLAKLFPTIGTVEYTFPPSNPDELELKRGERVKIGGIFDDGWCMCNTEDGRRGVIPMACLDIFASSKTTATTATVGTTGTTTDVVASGETSGSGEMQRIEEEWGENPELSDGHEDGSNEEGRELEVPITPRTISHGVIISPEDTRSVRKSSVRVVRDI